MKLFAAGFILLVLVSSALGAEFPRDFEENAHPVQENIRQSTLFYNHLHGRKLFNYTITSKYIPYHLKLSANRVTSVILTSKTIVYNLNQFTRTFIYCLKTYQKFSSYADFGEFGSIILAPFCMCTKFEYTSTSGTWLALSSGKLGLM